MKIEQLTLYTTQLAKQKHFYSEVLGLTIKNSTKDQVSFAIGRSTLSFQAVAVATPYHFAINIPANHDEAALAWLKARTTVLKSGEDEIQDFDFWNAKAIYFYDPDRNIVEFIARKNLANAAAEVFGAQQLLEISEIGVPTKDMLATYESIQQIEGIEIFSGAVEKFCAIGDEHGLFICIAKEERDWFPVDDKAYSSPFELRLRIASQAYQVSFREDLLEVNRLGATKT